MTLFRPEQGVRLPTNPTPDELRRILAASHLGAFAVEDEQQPAELKYSKMYLTGQEITGTPRPAVTAEQIRARFAQLDWEHTFKLISAIAARLHDGGIMGPFQTELLKSLAENKGLDRISNLIGGRIAPHVGKRAILHERLLYVMQQLAAEECVTSGGRKSTPAELAFLGLFLNDHIDRGYESRDEDAAFASSLALALRFNHRRDHLRTIVRAYAIIGAGPPSSSSLSAENWKRLQERAFGAVDFDSYFCLFVYPAVLFAGAHWGELKDGVVENPAINVDSWYARAADDIKQLARRWLDELCSTRDEIAASNDNRGRGVPQLAPALLRRPFVSFGSEYWAASPWLVFRQLHTGIRSRLLVAAEEIGIRDAWTYTFGLMVEHWAQQVAAWAQKGPHFRGELFLPSAPGTELVEDVVWVGDNQAILFAVKSTLMGETAGFNLDSAAGVAEWYERYLFAERDKSRKQRAGVARLLHAKIGDIRGGKYREMVPPDVEIFPVFVMYDDPLENVGLTDWIARRCRETGVLVDKGVHPPIFCNLETFEDLMGVARHGRDLGQLLSKKVSDEWRRQRLDIFLFENVADATQFRLPEMDELFGQLGERSMQRLRDNAKIPTV